MLAIDVRVAAQSLGRLVDQVRDSGASVMISTPGRAKAILMPVDEFDSLQETLHALIQPNIREELAVSVPTPGAFRLTLVAAGRESDRQTVAHR
ncbi:type II toxin-antitoxin system Phd/YefM family antitoxin [Mycolicibacterium peregrinum]|uniref:type II toxin-antitoxin system Phd/YefM family antitoxin n=1 Tax=Mycolicibacterium peregrinum TaxID=43304 RepID=UPI0009EF026A|nr:type II toxin-antitoxin system Phd/YefM family antitoxin [Mycolicibacterium peregrinum]